MTNEINQNTVNVAAAAWASREREVYQNDGRTIVMFGADAFKAGAAWQAEQPLATSSVPGRRVPRIMEPGVLVPRMDPDDAVMRRLHEIGKAGDAQHETTLRMLGSIENRLMELDNREAYRNSGLVQRLQDTADMLGAMASAAQERHEEALAYLGDKLSILNQTVDRYSNHKAVCDRDAILAAVVDVGQKVEAVLDQVTPGTDDATENALFEEAYALDPTLRTPEQVRVIMDKIAAAGISDDDLRKMGDRPVIIHITR